MTEFPSYLPPVQSVEAFQYPLEGQAMRQLDQKSMFELSPIDAWMAHADTMLEAGDDQLTFTRPGSDVPEQAVLIDAVQKDLGYGDDGKHHAEATAVVKRADGSLEEIPVSNLMAWQQGEVPEAEVTSEEAGVAHLEEIFAPVETAADDIDGAAIARMTDPSFDPSQYTAQTGAVRVEGRARVDDWTRGGAANHLDSVLQRDTDVRNILLVAAQKDGVNPTDTVGLVDYIRENAAVRMKLGKLFLTRVDRLAVAGQVGDRIINNDEKSPPYPGYKQKMSARQYAALLAVSMLDGTFDNRKEKPGEDIQMDAAGKVIRAQHRDAAYKVL